MNHNPLRTLESLGQSLWLDYIRRDLIASGDLKRLINEDGLKGMTSNPSLFEKAISESRDYDADIRSMAVEGKDPNTIYESLSQKDVQAAADEFRLVYDKMNGADGFVSLEVSPYLANDTQGSIEEARRLWVGLDRPNVFIKIPATAQGIPAIRQLISEGININITLLFGLSRYRQVAEAYISGIEERIAKKKPVDHVASVASFFVSRVDSLVDPLLDEHAKNNAKAEIAKKLKGEVAVANAKLAYQIYKEIFGSNRFKKLAEQGVRTQRVLWASTSTKNPDYSDVKYIEELIAKDTINTVPLETLKAYKDHGNPQIRIEKDLEHAKGVLEQLSSLGINIDEVTDTLEKQGVENFNKPFSKLMEVLKTKSTVLKQTPGTHRS